MKNEHYDAAKKALAASPLERTLWDRLRQCMEEEGLPITPYDSFMAGRYVGEMLERGEFRGLTPEEAKGFEEHHGITLPTRTR